MHYRGRISVSIYPNTCPTLLIYTRCRLRKVKVKRAYSIETFNTRLGINVEFITLATLPTGKASVY